MTFSGKVRRSAFWLLDFLTGSKVRKHYDSIVLVLDGSSSDQAVQQREKALSDLLRHAVSTTIFYKNRIGFRSLQDFAVIDKSVVRGGFDSFVSRSFDRRELIPAFTSGSTGTPFEVYHDRNKKLRNNADTIFFAQLAGYTLGDRLVFMKIYIRGRTKTPFEYWMENTIPVDVIRLDDAQIDDLVSRMEKDASSFAIVAYSSALDLVCKYLQKQNHGRVKANVGAVIAISEALNDCTKDALREYFGAPVVTRYSNIENGIIAQQETSGSGRYLINTASYVVEILKIASDEQAGPGETGRIVITDLYNYGMPLIRYDTGDLGLMARDSEGTRRKYFEKIEGRMLDQLYDTKGNLVSSYVFTKDIWQYTDIKQFQLVQEGPREYTLRINAEDSFNREAKLTDELKAYLGEDAVFTVEYVSGIPLLSSGKRRFIVSKYSPRLSRGV